MLLKDDWISCGKARASNLYGCFHRWDVSIDPLRMAWKPYTITLLLQKEKKKSFSSYMPKFPQNGDWQRTSDEWLFTEQVSHPTHIPNFSPQISQRVIWRAVVTHPLNLIPISCCTICNHICHNQPGKVQAWARLSELLNEQHNSTLGFLAVRKPLNHQLVVIKY